MQLRRTRFALAQRSASSHEKKRNNPDWGSSLHHNSVLQRGKRVCSAIWLEAHLLEAQLDLSTPRGRRLSKSAHLGRQKPCFDRQSAIADHQDLRVIELWSEDRTDGGEPRTVESRL